MEMAAYEASLDAPTRGYPFTIKEENGMYIIYISELISSLISDISKGTIEIVVAAKFHFTVAEMIYEMCELI